MNTADDPAWLYFDSQHKHIIEKLNEVYEKGCRNIEGEILPFLLRFLFDIKSLYPDVKIRTESEEFDSSALAQIVIP